jgi:hypothetical protein
MSCELEHLQQEIQEIEEYFLGTVESRSQKSLIERAHREGKRTKGHPVQTPPSARWPKGGGSSE